MKNYASLIITGSFLLAGFALQAAPKVTVDFNGNDTATAEFNFKTVPSPAANDAATTAKFAIVDGTADGNGGGLEKLHDGKLPQNSDDPAENFFFDAGTDGGRLQVDLGHATSIKQVNTYSWHANTRGPQIYKLYASDGATENFNAAPNRARPVRLEIAGQRQHQTQVGRRRRPIRREHCRPRRQSRLVSLPALCYCGDRTRR